MGAMVSMVALRHWELPLPLQIRLLPCQFRAWEIQGGKYAAVDWPTQTLSVHSVKRVVTTEEGEVFFELVLLCT